MELSHDHKPSNPVETNRIVAAGGWVELNRVNGEFTPTFTCVTVQDDNIHWPYTVFNLAIWLQVI